MGRPSAGSSARSSPEHRLGARRRSRPARRGDRPRRASTPGPRRDRRPGRSGKTTLAEKLVTELRARPRRHTCLRGRIPATESRALPARRALARWLPRGRVRPRGAPARAPRAARPGGGPPRSRRRLRSRGRRADLRPSRCCGRRRDPPPRRRLPPPARAQRSLRLPRLRRGLPRRDASPRSRPRRGAVRLARGGRAPLPRAVSAGAGGVSGDGTAGERCGCCGRQRGPCLPRPVASLKVPGGSSSSPVRRRQAGARARRSRSSRGRRGRGAGT